MVVDFLSHIPTIIDSKLVHDKFLDEDLFVISTLNPWYADIAKYLVIGELDPYFSPKYKK